MVRRLITFVALVSCLAVLVATPGHAEIEPAAPSHAQTVAFTSTPPVGNDWFHNYPWGIGYVATAKATSGLPVAFSIPADLADVCRIEHVLDSETDEGTRVAVQFLGPGTCTLHADQAGDAEFLPAERVSQSFVIEKVKPTMSDLRARRGLLQLVPATFRATLLVPVMLNSHFGDLQGYPGQVVTFSVAGKPVCSGTTNADGVATCTAPLGLDTWTRLAFTASYAGDPRYTPVTATGFILG